MVILKLIDGIDWVIFDMADYFYTPMLIIIILVAGSMHQRKKIEENPAYQYYLSGLATKLFSALIFLLIFTEYYGWGDTCDYISACMSMVKLFYKDSSEFWAIFFDQVDWEVSYNFFDNEMGFPAYHMWRGTETRFVVSISSLFCMLGMGSYMPTTILVATFSYFGVWKLYLFFTNYYAHLRKQIAIAVLFFPSLLFWGSGVMKDTYTFAASGWLVYNIFMIFFKKQKIPINIIFALLNIYIIISIKPYIFVALFPGIVVWALFRKIKNIKNKVIATMAMPVMIVLGFGITMVVMSSLSSSMGTYGNVDQSIKKAQTIQQDLTRSEQYGENSYNIGTIDGTTAGMLKIAPAAIMAGMYRPFLWEARNPVMLISGLENFILLIMTLYLLFKLKVIRFFGYIFSDPILLFAMIFTIFFMFAVGMASANFGALVRYRIPAQPFFVTSVFIMLDKYKQYKKSRDADSREEESPEEELQEDE